MPSIFPSEGRIEARDAHFTATSNPDSIETWWSEQGKVYQEVFDAGVYSVMVGHTAFPAVDDTMINGQYIPSTISKKVITDLLKGEMGFKGVVITDGIGMAALYSLLPYEELIVALVNAGNDVILGSKIESGDIIEKAVLDGRIPMARIDDGCQRVLDLKEKLGMFQEGYYDLPYTAAYVAPHAPAGAMRLVGEECQTYYYAFNHGKEKTIGVSFGYPYIHYDTMENADTFINAYNPAPESMQAFVEAIFGEIEITGKSPVLLIPRANSR